MPTHVSGQVQTQGEAPNPAITKHRILIVEDNTVNQKVLMMLLSKIGNIDYEIANNGLEAVQKFQANPYDVILMDCQVFEIVHKQIDDKDAHHGWVHGNNRDSETRSWNKLSCSDSCINCKCNGRVRLSL